MKKFILFIILFLLIPKVYAWEEGVWTDEIIDDPNVEIEDTKVKYRWYQNIREYSLDYYIEEDNDLNYPHIDTNDYIQTDYSQWSDVIPSDMPNRLIESKTTNRYRILRPIRYLFLENFKGGVDEKFILAELKIIIDNEPISYSSSCEKCSPDFDKYINDGTYGDKTYIQNGGKISIDLGDYYGIEQINLKLYMYKRSWHTEKFDLYFNEGETVDDRNYFYKEIAIYLSPLRPSAPEEHFIIADETFVVNPVYSDWIYTDDIMLNKYYREFESVELYRYKDIKYRYYRESRQYIEGYHENISDSSYLRDDDSTKTFYLYKYSSKNIPKQISKTINKSSPSASDNIEITIKEPSPSLLPKDLDDIKPTSKRKIINKPTTTITINYKAVFLTFLCTVLLIVFIIRHRNLSYQK